MDQVFNLDYPKTEGPAEITYKALKSGSGVKEGATFGDYLNVFNSMGLQAQNPSLVYTSEDYEVDRKDPRFQKLLDDTLKNSPLDFPEVSQANNYSHAVKILGRRRVTAESEQRMASDSLFTKVGLGLAAGVLDPTIFVPVGGSLSKLKTGGKLLSAFKSVAVEGARGAAIGTGYSELFKAQGLDSSTKDAAIYGAALGGALGLIGAHLSGYAGADVEEAMFTGIDGIHTGGVIEGSEKIEPNNYKFKAGKVTKDFFYKVTGKRFFSSDVNVAMASKSDTLRDVMLDMASPTSALRDPLTGEILPSRLDTVLDRKEVLQGQYNKLFLSLKDAYLEATSHEKSFTGTFKDFQNEVSKRFSELSATQEKDTWKEIETTKRALRREMRDNFKQHLADNGLDLNAEFVHVKEGRIWRPALPDEGLSKIPEEELRIKKLSKKDKKKLFEELVEPEKIKFEEELDTRVRQMIDSVYEKHFPELSDSAIDKFLKDHISFYKGYLERGKEAGLPWAKNAPMNKLYRPRNYNWEYIKHANPKEVQEELSRALLSHPGNEDIASEIPGVVEEIYGQLYTQAHSGEYMKSSYVAPKVAPMGGHLKGRKLHLDESEMPNLINHDVIDAAGNYSFSMSGRLPFMEKFPRFLTPEGDIDFHKMVKVVEGDSQLAEQPITRAERGALESIIRDLMGDRRLNTLSSDTAYTFARNLGAYQALRLGGKFGIATAVELGANLFYHGITNIIRGGSIRSSLKTSARLLYTKSGKVDADVADMLVNSGLLETVVAPARISKFSDFDAGLNMGKVEHGLQELSSKYQAVTGMRYIQAVQEDLIGGVLVTKLKNLPKRWSKGTDIYWKRLGLTEEKARELGRYVSQGVDKLETFPEEVRDKLQMVISRGVRDSVMQGDSIHLPDWLKAPSAITRVMTQFMRFPMIAHTTLLKRFGDEPAKMGAAVFGAILTDMSLQYLREQATIATGAMDPMDAKFDYYGNMGEEAIRHGLIHSLGYIAQTGMLWDGINKLSVLTTGGSLGSNYRYSTASGALVGPSFGSLDTLQKVIREASGGSTYKAMRYGESLLPFMNFPILHEMVTTLGEENF